MTEDRDRALDIAVTGMAGRFPAASDIARLWEAVAGGQVLTGARPVPDLCAAGVPEDVATDERYVPVYGHLEDADRFDAEFFGITPRDAELMDPQQRLMLECGWAALEDAGRAPGTDGLVTGVYATASPSSHLRLMLTRGDLDQPTLEQVLLAAERDFLATRLAYRLGLRGPALTVLTACSSSLVAVHLAVQALVNGECDQALVVAASVTVPQGGHLYVPGGVMSGAGACRPFDDDADGTLSGSGVVAVLLRRFEDAAIDGDPMHGVVLGTATNNDGADKAGFTAPSEAGQRQAIRSAVTAADIPVETVGYLEAHGTGTKVGDPLEFAAAAAAYTELGARRGQIALGSVKATVGHLDVAAGLAGLVKALLVTKHGVIPPLTGLTTPNTLLDLATSPFRLPTETTPWHDEPRRAAVSSFGVGGTNAHVVVEQPPSAPVPVADEKPVLAVLSAADPAALDRSAANLARHLRETGGNPADIAHTLVTGRRVFAHRLAAVGRSADELAARLTERTPRENAAGVVFLFPGQGTQRPGMALPLRALPGFDDAMHDCLAAFDPSLREAVHAALTDPAFPADTLRETWLAQPALFTVEHAAATALTGLGLQPLALAGHSLGEFTAACLAGVFDVPTAARLVAERGRLMWDCAPGAMLALGCSLDRARELLAAHGSSLEPAATNSPTDTVVAGPHDEVDRFQAAIGDAVRARRLRTSHAFHTSSMAPAVTGLRELLAGIPMRAPRLPFAANVTGDLVDVADLEHLATQAAKPVRFGDAMSAIAERFPGVLAVEVGPGKALSAMAESAGVRAVPLAPTPDDHPLTALGELWAAGQPVDLAALVGPGRRVHLPGYPFSGPSWPHPVLRDGAPAKAKAEQRRERPTIAELWAEQLGRRDLTPDADFFDLGGDSLAVTRLARRISLEYGVDVPVGELLHVRTLTGQEELVRRLPTVDAEPVPEARPEQPLSGPLTHGQYAMWVATQADPANPAYTVPVAMRLRGPLDVPRLQACLDLLATRHPALRTRITVRDGTPWQQADLPATVPLCVRDTDDLEHDLQSAATEPIDLDDPPYVTATLFRAGADDAVLLLTLHHLVCDGWSLDLLVAELLDAYLGDSLDERPPGNYFEYVHWENSPAGREKLNENLAYWQESHRALVDVLEPPFAHHAPDAAGPGASVSVELALTSEDRRRVGELARATGTTPHAVWLAAFAATWHLIGAARAIPVGVPSANRGDGRFDAAVGAFVTLLPLVVPVDPARSFAELAEATTTLLVTGADHAAIPVADRATSDGLAELSTVFVLTGHGREPEPRAGLDVSFLPVRVEGTQTTLSCLLDEHADAVHGRMVADARRYGEADLRRLASAYERVLRTLLDDPHQPLGRFDALDDTDRKVHQEHGIRASAPSVGLPYQAFRTWVESTPDAIAVSDVDGGSLTYRQLAHRVLRCAAMLADAGVRRGTVLGVRLPRCTDYPAVVYAAWHLGAVVVPMRPEDPAARVRELLAAAGATHLVGHPAQAAVTELTLDALPDTVFTGPPVDSADAVAYSVFTSGTTGTPKCVAVTHRSLGGELAWRIDEIDLAPGDRVLQTIPLAFDPSFWQCFGPLAAGAGVVFLAADLGADPAELVSVAAEHAVTIVDVVPSLLAALDDDALTRLPARIVFCGGEPLPTAQADRYLKLGSGRLYNQYGPSETCIDASFHACVPEIGRDGTAPIGRPIAGARLYVLDDALRPIPVGTPGELYIGGAGVAVGYVGRPAATADRFLPDPFAGGGSRMYRTGDRVKWTDEGRLVFLGRTDNQVKIRGHRVEPEEVEHALAVAPGVHEAAVVVVGGTVARMVGFVTGDAGLDLAAVRTRLTQRLPSYMVPTEIRVLDALPTTANSKVDRAALAELAAHRTAPATSGATGTAAVVCDVFAAVLDQPVVGLDDDLYALGGASLGAAHIAAALTVRLGVPVGVATVLANPRVADLAAAVATVDDAETDSEYSGQDYVRELERILGRPTPPVIALVELDRPATKDEIGAAVRDLVARHGALAPLVEGTGWEPVRTDDLPADPADAYWLPEHVEHGLPDDEPGLGAVLLGDRHVLLRLARNRGDGGSVNLLADELRAILSGQALPPAPVPSARRVRSAAAEHWRAGLAGVRTDPWADTRPATRSFRNHGVRVELAEPLVRSLAARCARHGWAPATPYLAALGELLTSRTGSAVPVGIPVAHRDDPARAATVGRLVDLLPLVLTPGGGPGEAHRALLDSLANDLPLTRIAELIGDHEPARRPPVCVAAVITTDDAAGVVPDDPRGTDVPDHWSDLDLVLHVAPDSLLLSGSADLFEPHVLRDLLADIRHSLIGWADVKER